MIRGMRAARCLRRLSTVIIPLALVGCSGSNVNPPGRSTADPTPTTIGAPITPVLRCQDSVSGELGADWRRESVIAGPLAFARLRRAATERPIRPGGGAGVYKALAVVEPGRVVTAQVGVEAIGHASLNHGSPDPRREGGRWMVADGTQAITFEACPDRPTQFSGHILVDAARCIPLEVTTKPGALPWRVVISLGAGECR